MYLCLQGAEDDIVTAVATVGPVSIAFDVALGFQFYRKGVYTGLIKAISIAIVYILFLAYSGCFAESLHNMSTMLVCTYVCVCM